MAKGAVMLLLLPNVCLVGGCKERGQEEDKSGSNYVMWAGWLVAEIGAASRSRS